MADDEADLWAQVSCSKDIVRMTSCCSEPAATLHISGNLQWCRVDTLESYRLRRFVNSQIYGEEAPPEEKPAVQSAPAALPVQQKPSAFAAVIQPGVASLCLTGNILIAGHSRLDHLQRIQSLS